MSDVEFVEFTENTVSFNIVLDASEIEAFKEKWAQVKGCQAPLIEASKNGVNIFIPWVMGGQRSE